MSPQSRAATANTTFASRDDGFSGNSCSGASSIAEIARAANMEYALHKIESESSTTALANTHTLQATENAGASTPSRKRSSARTSSLPASNVPFLSSYGSAFLSGIFADIAQASPDVADPPAAPAFDSDGDEEPHHKKARTMASTSVGRQPKSYGAPSDVVEGAVSEVSSPSVVSPRLKTSTIKIKLFNDQVRELQDMAFPSLPHIPIAVSTSSCSTAPQQAHALREATASTGETEEGESEDSPAYGWFVSTDDDDADTAADITEPSAPMFLPDTKPDLAFKALTAPGAPAEHHDLEVQQALAADTIDDVLGDLF